MATLNTSGTGGIQSKLQSVIGPEPQCCPSLEGKTALVTGGSLGIGYGVAQAFVKAGARVLIVSRSEDTGLEAVRKFKQETEGNASVEWLGCDLGDYKQIKEVFGKVAQNEERLDIVILNAGIHVGTYDLSANGYERIFDVNWLGQLYALNQLWPLILKTSKLPDVDPPRVVFESSMAPSEAPTVEFKSVEEINNPRLGEEDLGPVKLYGRSKLADLLGVKALYEYVIKPNNERIYAFSVHPGTIDTDLHSQWQQAYPTAGKILEPIHRLASRSIEQGTWPTIYAACSSEPIQKGQNGCYFCDVARTGQESSQAQSEELKKNLWELSYRMIKDKVGEDGWNDWIKA